MRRNLPEDLLEEDVFKEFGSPVLDQRNLDSEKSFGLEALFETLDGGFLAEEDIPGFGEAKQRLIMPRKWDFPDPKWPFRKIPRPSGPEKEVRIISRLFITSAVTTKELRIISRRWDSFRSLS